jgi:hypothetical protein
MSTRRTAVGLLFLALFGIVATTAAERQTPNLAPPAAAPGARVYVCPMHPEVRSDKPGSCSRCGMPLVASAPSPERSAYRLELETDPVEIRSGKAVRLRFRVRHPATGEPVTKFEIVHERPFHLFVVSRDFAHFAHIHPMPADDGTLSVETVFPRPGRYTLFSDFFPVGGTPQVLERDLTTSDFPKREVSAPKPAELVEGGRLVQSSSGVRVEVNIEPREPVAGRTAVVSFRLFDAADGRPLTDLQPYLGAWGHAVALREDGTDFVHTHASAPASRSRAGAAVAGPISFPAYFRSPGRHRFWSEFRRGNDVFTVSFDVAVGRLERVAAWNGAGWMVPAPAGDPPGLMDGAARALALRGRDLYVGGDFQSVNGVRANGIARWDGQTWSSLGAGVDGRVWAIAVGGEDVYVGGDFTSAGGAPASGVARWDGRGWSALGAGIGGRRDASGAPTVFALAWSGGSLYAGGRFSTAGGVVVNGIARWNGHDWTKLGDGVRSGGFDGVVYALAARGDELYAGGQFLSAGAAPAENIARWNGSAWAALGGGVRGNLEKVLALGLVGKDLYVGGVFNRAGGVPAFNLARWNAGGWSSLPLRAVDGVWAIAVNGPQILVGGASFALPDGRTANGIVRGSGEDWSVLGESLGNAVYSGPVFAIASRGREVFVGGDLFRLPAPEDAGSARAR